MAKSFIFTNIAMTSATFSNLSPMDDRLDRDQSRWISGGWQSALNESRYPWRWAFLNIRKVSVESYLLDSFVKIFF